MLNSHDKELEIDDLVNLEQERAFNIEELEDDENEEKTKELTVKELEEILRIGEVLKEKIVNVDPILQKSIQVSRETDKAIYCYKLMCDEKKKKIC